MFGLTYLVYGKKLVFRGAVVEERIGVGIARICVGYP